MNGLSKTITLKASGIIKTAGCPVMAMNTTEAKAGHTVFIHSLQMEAYAASSAVWVECFFTNCLFKYK